MKSRLLFFSLAFLFLFIFSGNVSAQVVGSRMKEVFKVTTLSPNSGPTQLNDPWEITYGPDGYLWVTESRGYKVYRLHPDIPNSRSTVLDLSPTSGDLSAYGADSLRAQNSSTWSPWPQGGLAGLALHPDFTNPDSAFVYISYVHRYLYGSSPSGIYYRNKLVRFTYNSSTGKLGSPVVLCDTLPGSKDHNSQRMIIAPEVKGGKNFLFYASGDMGSGQYENRDRPMKAQNPLSYEGKILRFNLTSDGDPGAKAWIPNDNPYGDSSAVYCIGIRNNQGFAYDTALNILYGSSHGPYSDDEINIIERRRNYGHPLVVGYATDSNYNGSTAIGTPSSLSAGVPYTTNSGKSTAPPIGNEAANAAAMDANGNGLYKDPMFSAYPVPRGELNPPSSPSSKTIGYIWRYNPANAASAAMGGGWPSEAWSGLDLYSNTVIPGWHKSLVAASLKWGRLVRLPLGPTGTTTMPSNIGGNPGNVGDTISYFGSTNRFRDLAFHPNGRDIYVIMDKSATTSGPSSSDPIVPACGGCVQKYTFLGYANSGGESSIPTSISVSSPATNQCLTGATVVINDDNKNLWVPITGPDGNIVAEIYPNGQLLDTVWTSFYINGGPVRSKNGKRYLDRNITITPKNQPAVGNPVKVRLYITEAEYLALKNAPSSAISDTQEVKVFKNNDVCGSAMSATPSAVTMDFEAKAFGPDAFVLQGTINSFSTFYFGSASLTTLPLDLINFSASRQNNNTVQLKWTSENEVNVSSFEVERSADGSSFSTIGTVAANGSLTNSSQNYSYTDRSAANVQAAVLYYRLRMLDRDGSYKYSEIISVNMNVIAGRLITTPNPTHGIVNLSIVSNINQKAQWKVTDNAGRVLLQSSVQLRPGSNNWSIDISGLAAGTYHLTLSGTGIDQKVKVQKL